MAKVKIKKNNLNRVSKQIKQELMKPRNIKTFADTLRKSIIDENILRGRSPVNGQGRFVSYSDSYKQQIRGEVNFSTLPDRVAPFGFENPGLFDKRVTPVNLKVSGQLLKSFEVSTSTDGLRVQFTDKIASYHNNGSSFTNRNGNIVKLPKRQLLPNGPQEKFNRSVTRSFNAKLTDLVKNILRRTS